MSVNSEQLLELLRDLVSSDARDRERAADRSTDWVSAYSEADGHMLAAVLSVCAACEPVHSALEAQLHALLALGEGGLTDTKTLTRLRAIDRGSVPGPLREYIDDLLETE
ncbi:hypothetical protein ACGFRG_28380 [Streptomyces sp. NPDC048696]|uniref:hypothetical protein n=1 Tax=Streptomyces sp. NPDC048696 TaxID=3365585 RepID=UPI00371C8F31